MGICLRANIHRWSRLSQEKQHDHQLLACAWRRHGCMMIDVALVQGFLSAHLNSVRLKEWVELSYEIIQGGTVVQGPESRSLRGPLHLLLTKISFHLEDSMALHQIVGVAYVEL